MSRDVRFAPSAQRDLRRIERATAARIVQAIERYASSGYGDVKHLRGSGDEWRLRVGDWRVRFRFADGGQIVEVLRVLPRGRAYRD